MRVTRNREGDARGHLGKNVGLVHEQDYGIVGVDACQSAGQVIHAPDERSVDLQLQLPFMVYGAPWYGRGRGIGNGTRAAISVDGGSRTSH
jgi:hypothetical protein